MRCDCRWRFECGCERLPLREWIWVRMCAKRISSNVNSELRVCMCVDSSRWRTDFRETISCRIFFFVARSHVYSSESLVHETIIKFTRFFSLNRTKTESASKIVVFFLLFYFVRRSTADAFEIKLTAALASSNTPHHCEQQPAKLYALFTGVPNIIKLYLIRIWRISIRRFHFSHPIALL